MPDTAGLGELWIRASRIRETCSISVHVVAVPPGWMVRIERYRDPESHAEGTGGHVLEALAAAIKRAESMGLGPAGLPPEVDDRWQH
jgi:hypothetical protein